MRRRQVLGLLAGAALWGCAAQTAPAPVVSDTPTTVGESTPVRPGPLPSPGTVVPGTPVPTGTAAAAVAIPVVATPSAVVVKPLAGVYATPAFFDAEPTAVAPAVSGQWPIAFSPDGGLLAVAQGAVINCYALPDLSLRYAVRLDGSVRAIMFSPDGAVLAAGGEFNSLRLWRARDGSQEQIISPPHLAQRFVPRCLAFSADGQLLGAGSYSNGAAAWRVADRESVAWVARPERGNVPGVAFSRDGTQLIYVDILEENRGDYGVFGPTFFRFWDIAARREAGLPVQTDAQVGAGLGADGSLAVLNPRGALQVWRLGGLGRAQPLRAFGAAGPVRLWALSADGERMAGVVFGRETTVWRVSDGAVVSVFQHGPDKGAPMGIESMAISADGGSVATLSQDGLLRVWG